MDRNFRELNWGITKPQSPCIFLRPYQHATSRIIISNRTEDLHSMVNPIESQLRLLDFDSTESHATQTAGLNSREGLVATQLRVFKPWVKVIFTPNHVEPAESHSIKSAPDILFPVECSIP